jgi:hypothetical protein
MGGLAPWGLVIVNRSLCGLWAEDSRRTNHGEASRYNGNAGERPPPRLGEPTREQGFAFLALSERVLERFRPDVILTYGGQWLAQKMMACAKRHGARVVFATQNVGRITLP